MNPISNPSALDQRLGVLSTVGVAPEVIAAFANVVRDGSDGELHRINALEFARKRGLSEDDTIAGFVHAAKNGLFELEWHLVCPGCCAVLHATTNLKQVQPNGVCHLCVTHFEMTLDEQLEVSFTVSPSVRRIPLQSPDALSLVEYYRHMVYSTGLVRPDEWSEFFGKIAVEAHELAGHQRITLALTLNTGWYGAWEPVTHGATLIEVAGEPTRERQELTIVFSAGASSPSKVVLRPGPAKITLVNNVAERILPGLFLLGDELHDFFHARRGCLTAKRLLTTQAFRDVYRTDTLAVDQQFKIASLTILFTDLTGSTEMYERVGDLVAFELVKSHFGVLAEAVRRNGGAVVKTIGDAVMATFPTAERGFAAALEIRAAMARFNAERQQNDLLVKIGLHEGPCLAVMLNDRLDYFGQAVNIAARVQGLADASSIFATEPVVSNAQVSALVGKAGMTSTPQRATLRGIKGELTVYQIR